MRNLNTILEAYFECALWCDEIEGNIYDVLPTGKKQAEKDIQNFLKKAGDLLTDDWTDEQVGHDLWLTRNGHGSGFWDKLEPNGDKLTEICHDLFKGLNIFKLESGNIEIY